MTRHALITSLLGLIFTLLDLAAAHEPAPAPAAHAPRTATAGDEFEEWHYTMNVHIRLLLFWISREGVGGARIASRVGADGARSLHLLIGSDPTRAPMRINRWGYVAENVAGPSAELVGVMTQADERSIEQARRNLGRSTGTHAFRAIRCRLGQGEARSTVIHLSLPEDFSFRDVNALLARLPQTGPVVRTISVPDGTEPGFLFALQSLLHASVESYRRSGRADDICAKPLLFVYNASLWELTQRSSRLLSAPAVGPHRCRAAIEGRFVVRNKATGDAAEFLITYGAGDPFAEVPLRIVYRPRWWLEAELVLDGSDPASGTMAEATPWRAGFR